MDRIIALYKALTGFSADVTDAEFKFGGFIRGTEKMTYFISFVEEQGFFPCEDWLLMSVFVTEDSQSLLTNDQRNEDTQVIDTAPFASKFRFPKQS